MVVMWIAEEGRNCNALTVDFLEHEVFGPPQLLPHCSSSSNQIRTERRQWTRSAASSGRPF